MNKQSSHFGFCQQARLPYSLPNTLHSILPIALSLAAYGATAQSNLDVYGRLDLAVRHISNANKNGGSVTELMPGATGTSRWGVRGSEDLGGGLKANFQLEGGINPDLGSSAQSGRLFGRNATVGLEGAFGSLKIGRQISLAYEVEGYNEPFGWANVDQTAFIYDNYTSKRWDNALRYDARFAGISGALMYSLGEQPGNHSGGRNLGASLAYTSGALSINSVLQQTHNSLGVIEHELASLGASYVLAPFKFFVSYLRHQSEVSIQKNHVCASGLSYAATPAIDLIASYYYDKQSQLDGDKKMLSIMFNYKLSKRSNLYLQADRGRISGAYASNVFDDQGYRYAPGITQRSSLALGMRHQF